MTFSSKCRALTKESEECVLHAYQDPVGIWTIAWGYTHGVFPGQTCTQEQADAWLDEMLTKAAMAVMSMVHVPITQGQLDALTDFVYNLGSGSLLHSTLLAKLNAGDVQGAAEEFGKWVHARGKVLPGLVTRRQKEKELFLS